MSLLESIIGSVSPGTCIGCEAEGDAICNECASMNLVAYGERCGGCGVLSPNNKTCASCMRSGLPSHIWISSNFEGLIQKLVYRYKFDHQRSAAKVISDLMLENLESTLENYLVVHIPTSTNRVRERSFDHCKLLAKQISRKTGLRRIDALGRLGQMSQVGSNRSERFKQTSNHYYVKNHRSIFNKKILLVDDVMTTGATLSAATVLLRKAGARRVDAIVLAKRI